MVSTQVAPTLTVATRNCVQVCENGQKGINNAYSCAIGVSAIFTLIKLHSLGAGPPNFFELSPCNRQQKQ